MRFYIKSAVKFAPSSHVSRERNYSKSEIRFENGKFPVPHGNRVAKHRDKPLKISFGTSIMWVWKYLFHIIFAYFKLFSRWIVWAFLMHVLHDFVIPFFQIEHNGGCSFFFLYSRYLDRLTNGNFQKLILILIYVVGFLLI